MKPVYQLAALLLVSLVMLGSTCDGHCDNKPDLAIPWLITTNIPVATTPYQTYIGQQYFASGGTVSLFPNSYNEFYSLTRTDAFGYPIVFYWHQNTPPPFSPYYNPPFHPIQVGEVVGVHKVIVNNAQIDFDCLNADAPKSITSLKYLIEVENGEIVSSEIYNPTPSIPAGGYTVTTFPVELTHNGFVELVFEADANGELDEEDDSNNVTPPIRPGQNFGG